MRKFNSYYIRYPEPYYQYWFQTEQQIIKDERNSQADEIRSEQEVSSHKKSIFHYIGCALIVLANIGFYTGGN